MVCQGLVRGYTRGNGAPRCKIKMDIMKAYDTIEWDFIKEVLQGLNFPEMFINWIMICVTTAKFSLFFNCSPLGFFSNNRGIRQGDPISPYLFVLCLEYFSRLMKQLRYVNGFRYHAKCKAIDLTHLCFADDMIIVFYADKESVLAIKETVDSFSASSGLCVSLQKTHVFLVQ